VASTVDGTNTQVFTVTADPLTSQYTVTLLQAPDNTYYTATSLQAVSGGNNSTYILKDTKGAFTIEATATGGRFNTVNTSGYIGVDNNFIDSGEILTMKFNQKMGGLSFTVDAFGAGESLIWTALDGSGNVVKTGTLRGTGPTRY
jgi:hypothetical protein